MSASMKSPSGVEVRYVRPGELDEVVASNADIHLEYMSERAIWIRVGDVTINLYAAKGKLVANVEIDP